MNQHDPASRAASADRSRTIDFRHAPRDGWTLICRPDDPFKSLVREDGALLYDFDGRVVDVCRFGTVLEFSAETSHPVLAVDQRTESARRPIVRTIVRYPDQTLELLEFSTVYGGRRNDVVLWTITPAGGVDELLTGLHIEAHLGGDVLAGPPAPAIAHEVFAVALDAPRVLPPEGLDDLPRLPPGSGVDGPCVLRSVPQPLVETHAAGFRPVDALMTAPALLRGGAQASGAIVVPLDHVDQQELDQDWARAALEHERRYWDALDPMPLAIRVPDAEVQDMLVASARNILQAREIEDGLPVMHVGPTIYRGLWLVDGHFLLEAARYLGQDEAADAGLEVLLRRVRPDGSIAQMAHVPHIKETGIAIATLVRQTELTGDRERLRRHWPVVRAAAAHIEELRRQAMDLPAEHPLHGLMPEAFGDGGLAGGARPEYTTAAWTLIGLQHAARGARELGEAGDAARFESAFAAMRADFERAAGGQRRPLPDGGGDYLPMGPALGGGHIYRVGAADGEVPRWRQIQPETATWALCHAIWPGEVFAPGERWVQDLLALYEQRDDEEGIPATTGFQPYRAVWTYAASFAAHVWLYAGRPDKAVDYLYGFANHAFPTRVWREEQSLASSGSRHITGDMPHNWASAELVRLVRHLLVFERGDQLELLAGAPAEWLRPGCSIVVERTPTRFGPVSLRVEAGEDGIGVEVTRHGSDWPAPRAARLLLPGASTDVALLADVPVTLEVRR